MKHYINDKRKRNKIEKKQQRTFCSLNKRRFKFSTKIYRLEITTIKNERSLRHYHNN